MPIKRINEFPSSSGATPDDLVLMMDDPSGSGITQRISIQSLFTSPALSGVPTAPTASSGTSTLQIASTAFVRNEISNLVDSAPALLDTLNELAAAINDDSGYFLTIGSGLALKANINNPTFTGYVTIPSGNGNFNTLTVGSTGVSISGHSHTASDISDFSSSVSGLLPVKNVVEGSGVSVTSSSGTFTVGVSGLNASYIADFSSSVSGLLPVKNVVEGSGVSVTSSSGTFTVSASGLDASYISDFSSAVSGVMFGADGTLTLPQGGVIDETLNVDTLTLVNAGLVAVNQTYIKTSPTLYTGSNGVTIVAIGDGVWFCIQGGDTKYSSTDNLTTWDNSTGGLPVPTSTVNPGVDTVNITVGNETWTFGQDGNLTFPDGSIQTTAYPGNANISTCLLHEYADPSGVSTPTSVAIDGMSYGGGQVVVDSAFGLGSSRVTLYSNSMFAMVAVDADIDTVYYNGESGSDGDGDKSLSVGVSNYRGYYSYHNLISGSDPAIQQIVISKSSIMSGSNRSIDTNNDDFTVTGLSGSDVIIVLNLYWGNTNGPDYSTSTTVAIQQFIDLVMFDEATPRTNINDIRTAFYDNSATIKTAIENEESDLLFDGFEFYRSFQKVTPSGGSGSGAVLEIEVFDNGDYDDQDVLVPGTGYQINDTLTVTGDLLGGTTPANDVTITVLSVNPGGGIIGYSVVGTSISTLWPDSYIIDGDDDQYDIGNFIGTNRTRSTAMVTLAYDPIEEDGNGGDDVFQILTILSADKTISEGQWVWFEEQNNGAFINYTLSTGGLNSSDIGDFSSAVSELLPVKNVVQGSGVSVTSSGGTFTVGVSGLDASYISDFSSSVSGLLPTLSAGSGINLSAGSGNSIIISSSGTVSSYPTPTVVNLSVVSSTVSTDASAGQIFNVALTSSATLSNPTNPIDGVTLRWRIQQDAYGSHTVTLGDKFQIPTSATSPLPFSTAPYTIDLLAATYNSANDNWDIIAFVMGY